MRTTEVPREAPVRGQSRYLTDGHRLFRVVPPAHPAHDSQLVGLEDCVALDVRLISADELAAMGLRPVIPAASV